MPNWSEARAKQLTEKLLNISLESLFCRRYGYNPLTEKELIVRLKAAGIENPLATMEKWRKNENVYTDMELHETEEEGPQVLEAMHHLDGDPRNNALANLQIIPWKENRNKEEE